MDGGEGVQQQQQQLRENKLWPIFEMQSPMQLAHPADQSTSHLFDLHFRIGIFLIRDLQSRIRDNFPKGKNKDLGFYKWYKYLF